MDLSLKDAVDKIVAESNDLKSAEANVKKAKAQFEDYKEKIIQLMNKQKNANGEARTS